MVALLVVLYFGWSQHQVQTMQQLNRQLNITMQKTADALEECNTPGVPGNVHECYDTATGQVVANARINQAGITAIVCLLRLPPPGTPGGRTAQDVDRCLAEFDRLLDEEGHS